MYVHYMVNDVYGTIVNIYIAWHLLQYTYYAAELLGEKVLEK